MKVLPKPPLNTFGRLDPFSKQKMQSMVPAFLNIRFVETEIGLRTFLPFSEELGDQRAFQYFYLSSLELSLLCQMYVPVYCTLYIVHCTANHAKVIDFCLRCSLLSLCSFLRQLQIVFRCQRFQPVDKRFYRGYHKSKMVCSYILWLPCKGLTYLHVILQTVQFYIKYGITLFFIIAISLTQLNIILYIQLFIISYFFLHES